MPNLSSVEIKAFLPSKDFEVSKRFYQDLGFTLASSGHGVAYFHHGNCSFLLQEFYAREHAQNFMMHLLVENVEDWWQHVEGLDLPRKYRGASVSPPADRPWAMRDFALIDPSGVLWRIAQNLPRQTA